MALTQISTAGVKDDAVTSGKIPANAIGSSEIAANAVGSSELADNAVDTAAIANNAVTQDKIAANAVQGSIIADGTVTNAKLASNSVTNAKIAGNAISSATIIDANVTTAKIADGNVTAAKLASGVTDLSNDTSPELGGELETNGNDIHVHDNDQVKFGAAADLYMKHSSSHNANFIVASQGDIEHHMASSKKIIKGFNNSGTPYVALYQDGNKKFETFASGIKAQDLTSAGSYVNLVTNAGSQGSLYGTANTLGLLDGQNHYMIKGVKDGAVELYHDNVKQVETYENGIILSRGTYRGIGGTRALLGGSIDPSSDKTWNFSFNTNAAGTNNGYVFHVKFYMNHWNHGDYYKIIDCFVGGRGNTTSYQRVNNVNNLGTGSASWSNGHIDIEIALSGGVGNTYTASALLKVKYDADSAPSYTSSYLLEVVHSHLIGTISVS